MDHTDRSANGNRKSIKSLAVIPTGPTHSCSKVARFAVDVHTEGWGRILEWAHVLSNEGGNQAGQHVPRTARGHARIAGRIAIETLAVGDQRAVALQHNHHFVIGCIEPPVPRGLPAALLRSST